MIVVRGGNGAARKVFRDLSAVFSFAVRRKIVPANPCEKAVVRKTDNHKTRYLSHEEVARLGAACDSLEAEGINPKALNITRLWALTGCRRQEVTELKWTKVDFELGLLCLAGSKTGKSIRPLAAAAIAILKTIEREEDSPYVFPADRGDGAFQGTKTIWPKIVKRSDVAKGFVVLPLRWVVERTLAWLNRNRRLAKDFEQTIASATAWLFSIQLYARRIARP
jgi:integrase